MNPVPEYGDTTAERLAKLQLELVRQNARIEELESKLRDSEEYARSAWTEVDELDAQNRGANSLAQARLDLNLHGRRGTFSGGMVEFLAKHIEALRDKANR